MLETLALPLCAGSFLLTAIVMAALRERKIAIALVSLTMFLLAVSLLFSLS
jgi:hypothetical protein